MEAAEAWQATAAARLDELQSMLVEREARLERLTASMDALTVAQQGEVKECAQRATAAERQRMTAAAQHAKAVGGDAIGTNWANENGAPSQVEQWKAEVAAHQHTAAECRQRAMVAEQAEAAVTRELAAVCNKVATLQTALEAKEQAVTALQAQHDALRQVQLTFLGRIRSFFDRQ